MTAAGASEPALSIRSPALRSALPTIPSVRTIRLLSSALLLASFLASFPSSAAAIPLVAFLGDSLTAGQGLPAAEAYPQQLADRLEKSGHPIRIVNGGISGDTSAGGARRVGWLLRQKPDLLVVALGANDGLRGFPVEQLERNLESIVEKAEEAGVPVLLLGMRIPPSLGEAYAEKFAAVYGRVARRHSLPSVPFFLDGVAGIASLNQPDGVHPNAKGQALIAANIEGAVRKALGEPRAAVSPTR